MRLVSLLHCPIDFNAEYLLWTPDDEHGAKAYAVGVQVSCGLWRTKDLQYVDQTMSFNDPPRYKEQPAEMHSTSRSLASE